MTRDEAIASMKADIEKSKISVPGWSDEIIINMNDKDWTPNQLVAEAEQGTEVGLKFVDTIYIPNRVLGPDPLAVLASMLGISPLEFDQAIKQDAADDVSLDDEFSSPVRRTLH